MWQTWEHLLTLLMHFELSSCTVSQIMSKTFSITEEQVNLRKNLLLGITEKLTDKGSGEVHQENLETKWSITNTGDRHFTGNFSVLNLTLLFAAACSATS